MLSRRHFEADFSASDNYLIWPPGGLKALQSAASHGFGEVVQTLLRQHQPHHYKVLLTLRTVARQGQAAFVAALLEYTRATQGYAQLDNLIHVCIRSAAVGGHYALVDQLFAQSEDIDGASRDALLWAAANKSVSILRMLLARGDGMRAHVSGALQTAAEYGQTAAAKVLLAAGAEAASVQYSTYFLSRSADDSMLRLLLRHGMQLSEQQEEDLVREAVRPRHRSARKQIARMVIRSRLRTRASTKRLEALMQ